MKTFTALFLAVFVTLQVIPAHGAVSEQIEKLLVYIINEMENGFPERGIPPLAPLVINYKNVNIESHGIAANATVSDLVVHGLNDIDIQKVKVNVLGKKFEMKLRFNGIFINTDYIVDLLAEKYNFTLNVLAEGPSAIIIENLDFSVVSKFKFNLKTGKVQLKTLDVVIGVGDIETDIKGVLGNGKVNQFLNEFLSNDLTELINDNAALITDLISTLGLPIVNDILKDFNLAGILGRSSELADNIN